MNCKSKKNVHMFHFDGKGEAGRGKKKTVPFQILVFFFYPHMLVFIPDNNGNTLNSLILY